MVHVRENMVPRVVVMAAGATHAFDRKADVLALRESGRTSTNAATVRLAISALHAASA